MDLGLGEIPSDGWGYWEVFSVCYHGGASMDIFSISQAYHLRCHFEQKLDVCKLGNEMWKLTNN